MRNLAGKGDLRLISELLDVKYNTLRSFARNEDFPAVACRIAGVRFYDVSKVARYLEIPLHRA